MSIGGQRCEKRDALDSGLKSRKAHNFMNFFKPIGRKIMKKIFLLATTAVFMTTANAWAEDLETSSMPVTFTLKKMSGITDIQPMKGGTITIDPRFVNDYDGTDFMDIVSFEGGIPESNSPTVKVTGNDYGSFKTTDTLVNGDHFYVQAMGSSTWQDCTVNDGSNCHFSSAVELADGLKLKDFYFYLVSEKCFSQSFRQASKAYLQDTGNYDEPKSYSITIGYDH